MHGLKPMHLDSKSEWTGYCKRCMFLFFFGLLKSHSTVQTGLYLLDAGDSRQEMRMRNLTFSRFVCISNMCQLHIDKEN